MVFISEMGDKTQLMALVLSARYRRPWTVLAGIFLASIFSLGLAAYLGGLISSRFEPEKLHWIVSICFFGFSVWMLFPEKEEKMPVTKGAGPFWTTIAVIFLGEMGDKAQFAVLALGARYRSVVWVTAGSSLGMLAADSLAVFFGERLTNWIPMAWVRRTASLLFAVFGLTLLIRSHAK